MTRVKRPPSWLEGKIIACLLSAQRHRGLSGFYMGVVTKIEAGPRIGFRGARITLMDGTSMRVDRSEMKEVEYRKSLVKLDEVIA